MTSQNQQNILAPLPHQIFPGSDLQIKQEPTAEQQIVTFLEETLPSSHNPKIKQELKKPISLDKKSIQKNNNNEIKPLTKRQRRRKRNRKRLSQLSECNKLNPQYAATHAIEIPETGWNYPYLLPLRDMWREYIKRCIGKPIVNSGSLGVILGKCEFIGADLRVEKSTSPTVVGLKGIVIKETQKIFEIVNENSELKKVPKDSTVLTFDVGYVQLTVVGKQLMTRPADRSVKKIKSFTFADI